MPLHSDTLLPLDELGKLEDRDAEKIAYLIAGGRGKARADQKGNPRKIREFRTTLLSTGETTLGDKIRATGRRSKAGQEVRIINILYEGAYGVFDDTKGMDAGEYANAIKSAAANWFGTVGATFVAYLVANCDQLDLRAQVEATTKRFVAEGRASEPQGTTVRVGCSSRRTPHRVPIGCNGLLSPWDMRDMEDAALHCFKVAVEQLGGAQPHEYIELKRALREREVTQQHGMTRFVQVTNNRAPLPGQEDVATIAESFRASYQGLLGYKLAHNGEDVWGFTSSGFEEIVRQVMSSEQVTVAKRMLADHGDLIGDASNRYRLSMKINGKVEKLIAVRASALED